MSPNPHVELTVRCADIERCGATYCMLCRHACPSCSGVHIKSMPFADTGYPDDATGKHTPPRVADKPWR